MVLNLIGNYIADKVTELLFTAGLKLISVSFKFICKGCSKFNTCICCCRKRTGQSSGSDNTQLQFHCLFCGSKYHSVEQCNSLPALQARQATHQLVYPDIQPPTPINPPSSSSSAATSSTTAIAKASSSKAPSLLIKGLDTSRIVKRR